MKTKTFTPMGALHPILFFAGVYAVVLMFSIFICSALFYSCNAAPVNLVDQKTLPVEKPVQPVDHTLSAVVMR
jgi:hypothetical protein